MSILTLAGFCSSHRWNRAEINLSHSCKGEWLPNLAVYMLIGQPLPVLFEGFMDGSIIASGHREISWRVVWLVQVVVTDLNLVVKSI